MVDKFSPLFVRKFQKFFFKNLRRCVIPSKFCSLVLFRYWICIDIFQIDRINDLLPNFQMLVPNASFVGHLAGILAGLAYVSGPLKVPVEIGTAVLEPILGGGNGAWSSYQRARAAPRCQSYESSE